MPANDGRCLIGPQLLLGLCSKGKNAVAWGDATPANSCYLSRLAIAIAQSVIDEQAPDATARNEWLRALDQLKARYVISGGTLIGVTDDVLAKWRYWRERSPLQFAGPRGPEEVEQDIRLLLATAETLGLIYVEYDSLYLRQAQRRGLDVHIVAAEP